MTWPICRGLAELTGIFETVGVEPAAGSTPAIAETAHRLLTATRSWNTAPLSGYPAFNDHDR